MEWEIYRRTRSKQLKVITDEAKKADTLILATDPDREGEAISWHVQEVLRQKKALPANVERVTFNAITKSAVTEAMAQSARARRGSDRRLPRPPRARLSGRLHALADPVAQAARRQVGRPRPVGRAAPDRRPRARDRAVQDAGILAGRRHVRGGRHSRSRRGWSSSTARSSTGCRSASKGEADAAKAVVEAGRFTVASVETKPFAQEPAAAVHHLDAAAGGRAQARLLGQPHDAGRPVALRGRADHLHADRRRRRWPRRRSAPPARRSPTATTAAIVPDKPRHYTSKAKNAQEAHEAIRPTDFSRDQGRLGRPCAALRADLQARAGEPDGVGAAGADDGRADRRRRAGDAARDRPGRALPGLLALYEEGRDDTQDEEGARMPRASRGRCAGEDRRRGDAALHPAAAALFRSEPGQAAGGARHRPAVDLRLDPPDAEGPRICPRSKRTASFPRRAGGW